MTAEEIMRIRHKLKMSRRVMAIEMGLKGKYSWKIVQRWEQGIHKPRKHRQEKLMNLIKHHEGKKDEI